MAHLRSDSDDPAGQLGLLFPAEQQQQPPEPQRRIWSVSALVAEIRGHLERSYADCWIEGEISGLRAAPSGHVYFTLKDEQGQLPVVLFRRQAQLLRFRPAAGLHVLVRGRVSIYEERGQLQMIAETLEPVGAGSLQFAFEQLKQRLKDEGLFDAERKRPLPAYPRCIGIITSPTGAVIRDFLNIVNRRHAGLDILLFPAVVQGESAAGEIASGILYFNRAENVDAIVLARGGGAPEDLAAFNAEPLARAIAASTIPVVSAVGHETDFTIADFVADLRAPTPSAAAELLTTLQHGVAERVDSLQLRLVRGWRYAITLARQRFAAVSSEASIARMRNRLDRSQQRVDEQQFRLNGNVQRTLQKHRAALDVLHTRLLRQSSLEALALRQRRCSDITQRLHAAMRARLLAAHRRADQLDHDVLLHSPAHRFRQSRQLIEHLTERAARAGAIQFRHARSSQQALRDRLEALSPLAVLSRGYSLTYTQDGQLLRVSTGTGVGDTLTTRLAQGTLRSTVREITDKS